VVATEAKMSRRGSVLVVLAGLMLLCFAPVLPTRAAPAADVAGSRAPRRLVVVEVFGACG